MKKILTFSSAITLFLFSINISIAQTYCGSARYDQEVFATDSVISNIAYGSNTTYTGSTQSLTMDIYFPKGDTAGIRPMIIWAHGGSFLGGGKTDPDVVSLCHHFAKRGYVTASINYRLGMSFPYNQATATQAVFRAVQDMKAAVRFFRQDVATANSYKIDPNMIFGGGSSAGAFMALHLAYLDQPSELPSQIDTTVIGGIEGNSGNPGYASEIKAVINLCGALGDKNYMVAGDEPLCSMHGTVDGTVPYATTMLSIGGIYPIMVVDGSYSVNQHADSIGVFNKMYTYKGADHVPYYGSSAAALAYMDTTVRFVSNFLYNVMGCTPTDPNPLPNTFVGISEISAAYPFTIFPNPSNGFVHVSVPENFSISSTVIIRDLTGRIILQSENHTHDFIIDATNLKKGIYFLEAISSVHQSVVGKLLIN